MKFPSLLNKPKIHAAFSAVISRETFTSSAAKRLRIKTNMRCKKMNACNISAADAAKCFNCCANEAKKKLSLLHKGLWLVQNSDSWYWDSYIRNCEKGANSNVWFLHKYREYRTYQAFLLLCLANFSSELWISNSVNTSIVFSP